MRLSRLPSAAVAVSLAVACAPAPAPAPATPAPAVQPVTTARGLVARMRDTWADRYFRTLAFRQKNTLYRQGGGEEPSEWLEYQQVPGRLRIEFQPGDQKNGILFRDNRQYTFTNGKLADQRSLVHPLLLLSADVYALPVDTTVAQIAALKIDTTLLHESTWDGRRAYVVGAPPGDTTTTQFWVDAERLVLLRLVQRNTTPQGRTVVLENRFTYQDVQGVPIPHVITFVRDGRTYWREEYVEPRLGVPLDSALFDPAQWAEKFGTATTTP